MAWHRIAPHMAAPAGLIRTPVDRGEAMRALPARRVPTLYPLVGDAFAVAAARGTVAAARTALAGGCAG